jgi:hypothetical protein
MEMKDDSGIEMPALGRPFQLGMFYDARNDRLIPGITLWSADVLKEKKDSNPQKSTNYRVSVEDNFREKTSMLNIHGNLKLSVLAGLVEVSGSAKYLTDQKTTEHQERLILKYSTTTRFDQLTMDHLSQDGIKYKEALGQQTATHVVTGITYGADAFFIFDQKLSTVENRTEIRGDLKAVINKIPKIDISAGVELTMNDNEKKVAKTLTCQFYGDFLLELNPRTFEDAVKLYQELPKLLGENGINAVPKKVWLHPLHALDNSVVKITRDIDNRVINCFVSFLEDLNDLQVKTNDLVNDISCISVFRLMGKQLLTFRDRISEFRLNEEQTIKKLIPQFYAEKIEQKELDNFFRQTKLSPFNSQKLHDWLELKTQDILNIKSIIRNLETESNIRMSPSSLIEARNDLNCEFVLCLVIHVTEKNDLHLNEMSDYLCDRYYNQDRQNSAATHTDQPDIFTSFRTTVKLFLQYAKANSTRQDIKFFVDEHYIEDHQQKKGASVILYKNGKGNVWQLPSAPGKPSARDVTYESITLQWSKPEQGSETVEKYKIYSYINSTKEWKLLYTTLNDTESITIKNLGPETTYKFKIQAVTLAGDTAESDVSSSIKTKYSSTNSVASKILEHCDLIQHGVDGHPNIYQIRCREIKVENKSGIQCFEVGEKVLVNGKYPENKNIALFYTECDHDATIINALVNYYYNITLKDHFRLQLIAKEDGNETNTTATKPETRQTGYAYTLHCQPGYVVPYTLTIIVVLDSYELAEELVCRIGTFVLRSSSTSYLDGFLHPYIAGIVVPDDCDIDAAIEYPWQLICRRSQNNFSDRLTHVQRRLLEFSQHIFISDILFEFNSSILFAKHISQEQESHSNYGEMIWKMNENTFQRFFKKIYCIDLCRLN